MVGLFYSLWISSQVDINFYEVKEFIFYKISMKWIYIKINSLLSLIIININ